MNPLLEAAKQYAALGWHVLPLHSARSGACTCGDATCKSPGKHPRTQNGLLEATTDPARLEAWWGMWPDANIGVATGPSKLVVVDVDPGHGGAEAWNLLAERLGRDNVESARQKTGGGGLHMVYGANGVPIRNSASLLGPGIDVRGEGGYIVAPPSLHVSGNHYEWVQGMAPWEYQPKEFPGCLVKAIVDAEEARERRGAGVVEGKIPSGQRNQVMASLAGSMRRRGMSEASIKAALLQENQRCEPPLSHKEVLAIAHSITKYKPTAASTPEPGRPVSPIPDSALPDGYPPNDDGNAQRFVDDHQNAARYVAGAGYWIVCNGKWWPRDETGQVTELGRRTARRLHHLAAQAEDTKAQQHISKWALQSGNAPRINAMVSLAQACLPVTPEELDADLNLLNVGNGALELESCTLLPHDPGDLVTKHIDTAYNAAAPCPKWEAFIDKIMGGDADKKRFLQQALGYALTGYTTEQVVFFLYGGGANGKSTLMETMRRLLGDYARNADVTTFQEQRGERVRSDLARLHGARLVTTSEGDEGSGVSEGTIKKITGGEPITASYKFRDEFEYTPRFKIFWGTNHKPRIRGADKGIWRRIRLIPFTVTIPEAEQVDQDVLLSGFMGEAEGILAWLVRGCADWQKTNLIRQPPPVILEAIKEYRDEMNVLGEFLDTCTLTKPDGQVTVGELYGAYKSWCETNNEKPLGKISLGNRLKDQGFAQVRRADSSRAWSGLTLRGEAGVIVDLAQTRTGKCENCGEESLIVAMMDGHYMCKDCRR